MSELRSTSPVRPAGRVSRGSSQEMLAIRRHRSTRGKLSQVRAWITLLEIECKHYVHVYPDAKLVLAIFLRQ